MKIKKGDTVRAIAGSSRGKNGKVLRVFPETDRLTVEGVNLRKKHAKPKGQGQKGQIVEFPAALTVSNVALICPRCGKATRIAMHVQDSGEKHRACKKCGQDID